MNLKNYLLGVAWFVLHLFCSAFNDIISKYVGGNLHSFEISFLRFFFSAIALVPFIYYAPLNSIKTANLFIHIIRGIMLFLGIAAWNYGIAISHVSTATVISFSIPIFTLLIAIFFLEEQIIWQRWLVTLMGFVGVMVTLRPHAADFNPQVLIFILAAIIFATLDIINKKFVTQESILAMLFYPSAVAAIFSLPPAMHYWQTPTFEQLGWLFLVGGVSANLILFFILKAFSLVDATALAPYRYLELLISSVASYLIFGIFPPSSVWQGAVILIPATLFIIYSENNLKKMAERA